jgi:hypothetical protein
LQAFLALLLMLMMRYRTVILQPTKFASGLRNRLGSATTFVTLTNTAPGVVNYDLSGTVWGGINFTAVYSDGPEGGLFLRGVPCVRLR